MINNDNTIKDNESADEVNDQEEHSTEKKKPEGSGIFTVDGKELPKVKGGYTLYHGGGSIGENDLK